MDAERSDYDVLIIGAGLIGLALAAALARTGLAVALLDRSPVAVRNAPADNDWEPRVYAISPGSAEFLHSLGAWQQLPGERQRPDQFEDLPDRGGPRGRRLHGRLAAPGSGTAQVEREPSMIRRLRADIVPVLLLLLTASGSVLAAR